MVRSTTAWMVAAAAVIACVPAAASAPEAVLATPADLAAAMAGSFATRPDDARNSYAETRILFENPALAAALGGGDAGAALVYSAILSGPERAPYRRRVTVITRAGGVLRSEGYAFAEPNRFAEALPTLAALAALQPDDLVRGIAATEGADCAMRWLRLDAHNWRGTIARTDCRLMSRRGGVIGLEAETRLSPGRIAQTERGFDEAGQQLFGTAPGDFIIQEAVPATP